LQRIAARIDSNLAVTLLIVMIVPLAFVGYLSFQNAEQALVQETLNRLETIASIQEAQVYKVVERNLERLRLVSSRTQLRICMESYNRDGNDEDKDRMRRILLDAKSSISDFNEISILNLDGEVIVSTNKDLEKCSFCNEAFFNSGKVKPHMDVLLDETYGPFICLSGPLVLEGNLLGVVVVNAKIDSINVITGDYTGLENTGETTLAKRDENGDALYITSLRFNPYAAMDETVDKDQLNVPVTQALLKNEITSTDMIDYRGETVFAATRYIESQDWGVVVKIDESEALASIGSLGNTFLLIGVTAIGLVSGLAAIYITQTQRLQERLLKSENMAAIGETAAMVGHDLRNPLQGILSTVELASGELETMSSQPEEKEGLKKLLGIIGEQVLYMDKIVSDLQDYARPLKPELVKTSLQQLIEKTLSMLSIPDNVHVSINIEEEFPRLMVDPQMMQRVFTNLIINAVQAMPEGGKLRIGAYRKGRSAHVTVQDTGVGIPEESFSKLFLPLFTTKSKGQGFGLSVCKRMVEAHNGRITVESEVGKGSTFTIYIPIHP